MTLHELTIEQQEAATYCRSCGEVATRDELSECAECGTLICGKPGCKSLCACDDAALELLLEWGHKLEDISAMRAQEQEPPIYGVAIALVHLQNGSMASYGMATV